MTLTASNDVMTKGKPRGRLPLDRREIGRIVSEVPGPSLVVVGGIHGNEPAGVEASRRVLARLARGDVRTRGELVVFAGNRAALAMGIRYQAKDLNRVWTEDQVNAVRKKEVLDPEDKEQLELLAEIEAAIGRARGRVHLCDFHTTSASGIPFILFGDTLPQRRFVEVFPIPVVLGLEEQVEGCLSSLATRRNCVSFGCEGGQHDDPRSVDNLEAVLWLALKAAGVLFRPYPTEVASAKALLEQRRAGLPRVLEVIRRHAITAEDRFVMEPGFRNLDKATEGQLLAKDKNGEIRAPKDGMVMLPLYQGLGNDGFFWGRALTRGHLKASEVLRALRLDYVLRYLPGVKREKDEPTRLAVKHVAKYYPRYVFNVFGYRRVREEDGKVTVERQPE